ncbi:MAG: DUF2339 domain-containing protein, partial [Thermoguttaceae bacterium]
YLIVVGRFCFTDLPGQYAHNVVASGMDATLGAYLLLMLERIASFGVPIGSLAGAFWLLRSLPGGSSLAVEKENDMPEWLQEGWAMRAAIIAVVGMVFVFLHLELNRTLLYMFPPVRLPVLSLLWVGLCALVVYEYLRRPGAILLGVCGVLTVAMAVKLFLFDMTSWHVVYPWCYAGDYSFLQASMRLLDFGAIIAFFGFAFVLLLRDKHSQNAARIFGIASLALLFIFLTLEVNSLLQCFAPGLRVGGVSILWSLFALGLLLPGIWKDMSVLRYAALALFAVVAVKVLFFDLEHLEQIYRIIAFFLLGILVLSGSFVYLKYKHVFTTRRIGSNEEDNS